MRALIVGIDSGIGAALGVTLERAGWSVVGTSRRPGAQFRLDLAALPERLDPPEIDVCFLCAAMTRQADCEAAPELSWRVNAEAPIRLARAVAATGGHIVFLSSNAVFDGSVPHCPTDTPPNPPTAYGQQKAAVEREILALPGTAALRLAKVLTPDLPLFCRWRDELCAGRPVTAFTDMVLAPIPVDDVVEIAMRIGQTRAAGIFQASAPDDVGYAAACRYLARSLGASESLVKESTGGDAGIAAASRPRFASLESDRSIRLLGRPLPGAFEAIARVYGHIPDCDIG